MLRRRHTLRIYHPPSVVVYAKDHTTPLRSITEGIISPLALAIDASKNLYVANAVHNSVVAYSEGGSTPSHVITRGINAPVALAVAP